jgi:hypothetical protein
MKKTLAILFLLSEAALFAQKKGTQTDPLTIARLIKYSVMIQDTSTLATQISRNGPETTLGDLSLYKTPEYLDATSFNQLMYVIAQFVKDTNTAVYDYNGKKVAHKEEAQRIMKCDSIPIITFDEFGNETNKMIWYCDSTRYRMATRIDFTECWTIDQKSFQISKEILCYTLCYFDTERTMWVPILTIYKDKFAAERVAILSGNR